MRFSLLSLALGLEMAFAWTGCPGQSPATKVRLLESAEINRETIRLSDLLPASAPAALKTASAAIDLGRAPQPGSVRVLPAGRVFENLARQSTILSQLSLPVSIAVRRTGWPISRQAIQSAVSGFLQQQGWREKDLPEAAALAWTGAAALVQNPALEVTATDWDNRKRKLQLWLRCVERSSCGSFLVTAQASQPGFAAEPQIRVQPSSSNQPAGEPGSAAASKTVSGPALTQAGDFATLIFESNGIRISLPVICLQRGFLRQEIRARDAAGQRVYHAEVIGTDKLRASF